MFLHQWQRCRASANGNEIQSRKIQISRKIDAMCLRDITELQEKLQIKLKLSVLKNYMVRRKAKTLLMRAEFGLLFCQELHLSELCLSWRHKDFSFF